jgi:tRNA G10  N-methylase Trm11
MKKTQSRKTHPASRYMICIIETNRNKETINKCEMKRRKLIKKNEGNKWTTNLGVGHGHSETLDPFLGIGGILVGRWQPQ